MWLIAGSVCLLQEELFSKPEGEGGEDVLPTPTKILSRSHIKKDVCRCSCSIVSMHRAGLGVQIQEGNRGPSLGTG